MITPTTIAMIRLPNMNHAPAPTTAATIPEARTLPNAGRSISDSGLAKINTDSSRTGSNGM